MRSFHIRAAVLACIYLLSGVTALAYEVLWVRMLSLQFGVSIFGVVITAVAFMAGLGLGSCVGALWQRHRRAPLLIFAWLEIGVAIYAILLPLAFRLVDSELGHLAQVTSLSSWFAIQGGVALLLLLIPAFAMGLGFPLVLKTARAVQLSLGQVYGWNTLGGALGALLPLILLPSFGWLTAIYIVAGLGLFTGLLALLAVLRVREFRLVDQVVSTTLSRPTATVLLAYAGIGGAALMLEVGWARLYGMILLRTEYVTALILAIYLAGVAIGSLLARRADPARWLNVMPLWAAAATLFSLWALPLLTRWVEAATFASLAGAILWQGLALVLLTLPVTVILGAWLPVLSRTVGSKAVAGAWLYGANSIGAALGALAAGLIVIPMAGTAAVVVTAALAFFLFGMRFAAQRRMWLVLPLLVLSMWPLVSLPPVKVLLPHSQAGTRDLYRYEDAVSVTHAVERPDGQRILLSDLQRMDASTDPAAVILQKNQLRLPLLLHGQAHSLLLLGMGTGISAAVGSLFPELDMTAVELSRGAITAAAKWFSDINHDIVGKMKIVHDDARHFLRAGHIDYDVIVGDVFHPDMVGRSALLSVQQFERARARLAPGGLFVQWLALNQFDIDSLTIVLRSFQYVFPRAVFFVDGFRIAMIGSKDRLPPAGNMLAQFKHLSAAVRRDITGSESPWSWLGRYWGHLTLPGKGPMQDEWAPHIEFKLPRARYRNEIDLDATLHWLLQRRPKLEQATQTLRIAESDVHSFERAFVANELAVRSWAADLRGEERPAQRLLRLAYRSDPQNQWIRMSLADKMLATLPGVVARGMDKSEALQAILRIYPEHVATLRALWHIEQAAGHQRQAEAYRRQLVFLSPLDRELQ